VIQPGSVPVTLALNDAQESGRKLLTDAGRRLASLWREIHARPPLASDGAIPGKTAPATRRKRRATPVAKRRKKGRRR
jgi:hypothetical protein